MCLCVFLVFWSKKNKQREEHQNIKAHENYAQIWRSYCALVFRSVEPIHRHSLGKIQWLKPVVMVTNFLRKFTSQYLRKKKTVLYPLLWYENTSHLPGEYTGDLDTQSPLPSITLGVRGLVIVYQTAFWKWKSLLYHVHGCAVREILFSLYSSKWYTWSAILEKSFKI